MSIKGLDASEFQGTVDWEKVKSAGYRFAMLRAGYGFRTLDLQFRRNAAECNRIGLPIGAYWFCYATSPEDAVQEADGCLKAISQYRLEYPVCYDIEQASIDYAAKNGITITPSLAVQIVQSFCNRIEEKGYYAMYYSNRNFLREYFPADFAKRYALWYAFYNSTLDCTGCGIWQFTSEGSIPGIAGDVDLDYSYVDYPAVIRSAGLNHLDEHNTQSAPNYMTYIVQSGDTLSSIAARCGTTYQILASLNGLSDPDLIYPGQRIRIPEDA